MNKTILTFVFFVLTVMPFAVADQNEQVITLKDGSQIKGELSGIENGVYTVKTPIIGDVHVAASDVASITTGNSAPVAAIPATVPGSSNGTAPNLDQQVAMQQKQLMTNPQAMADLTQMAQDPEIMQALSDPAIVQAVTTHDYQAVQNNPKIQALMQSPKMQALLQKIAAAQQQQGTSTTSQ